MFFIHSMNFIVVILLKTDLVLSSCLGFGFQLHFTYLFEIFTKKAKSASNMYLPPKPKYDAE